MPDHSRSAVELPTMRFNLFHRFATSELTHSGIWAWVLQSLDVECPEPYRELREPARALLTAMGVGGIESPVTVRRERKLPGKAGRVDIEVVDGNGQTVVIETKVRARPDPAQRQRYEDAYRAEGHRLVGITILSTTFDEPWGDPGLRHLGATALRDVLRSGSYRSDIMLQYVAWLENELATRQASLATAMGPDAAAASAALLSPGAQWGFFRRLGDAMGGPAAFHLYSGTNRGGTPWTQLAFSPGGPPDFDALFYRLDAWPGGSAEFTLRQYQKPASAGKPERLATLRALFADALAEAVAPAGLLDTRPKGARLRAQEAKVAQATIRDRVSPALLLEYLPRVHGAFRRRLEAMGWPLSPAGPGASGEGDEEE